MPDINIKPDIALGLKQQDPLVNIGNLVNTAAGLQSFRKAQELTPYEIKAGQAQSDLAVQNLLKARELLPYEIEAGKAQSSSAKSTAEKGKLEVKQKQMETDLATQDFYEQQNLIKILSDPLFTKEWKDANGKPDMDKLTSMARRYAPRASNDFLKRFAETSAAQTTLEQTMLKLDTTERELVSNRLALRGRLGETNPQVYLKDLQQLKTEYPNSKTLHSTIDAMSTIYKDAKAGDEVPGLAIRMAETFVDPTKFAPTAELQNLGGGVQQFTSKPSVGGKEPSISPVGKAVDITLSPGERITPSGHKNPYGAPTYYLRSADGKTVKEVVIPEGTNTPVDANTPPAQQQGKPQAGTGGTNAPIPAPSQERTRLPTGVTQAMFEESQKIREGALQSAGNYQTQLHDNNKIIELAKMATTGAGADAIAQFAGANALVPWTGDKATYFNELGHFLDKQAATLASTPGFGGTDAARSMAQSVSGTTQYTSDSLINIARLNRALSTGNYLFSQGIENGSKANPNNPVYAREFKNKWNQVADVNALKLYDAYKNEDKEQINQIVNSLGGKDSDAFKKLKLKVNTILDLVKGGK